RSEPARAEIAQLITAVAADRIEELLDPRELHYLSLLSIDTLLDRLRERAGMTQVVDLYRGSARRERRALLDAITSATEKPRARVRLGSALDPLFLHENDESLRALMIRRVAARGEPASARALGRWLGHAHGAATHRGRSTPHPRARACAARGSLRRRSLPPSALRRRPSGRARWTGALPRPPWPSRRPARRSRLRVLDVRRRRADAATRPGDG